MEFCPKCGSRLIPKKTKTENKIKINLVCRKGDYTKKETEIDTLKTPVLKNKENPKKFVTVITKDEQKLKTLPTIKVECLKCGNKKVYVWQLQTRGVDESSTQFMRCTKCDHTFREYT
jgi:DNA-directed RNA polymerase subunit M